MFLFFDLHFLVFLGCLPCTMTSAHKQANVALSRSSRCRDRESCSSSEYHEPITRAVNSLGWTTPLQKRILSGPMAASARSLETIDELINDLFLSFCTRCSLYVLLRNTGYMLT